MTEPTTEPYDEYDDELLITPTDLEGFLDGDETYVEDVRAMCEDATATAKIAAPQLRTTDLDDLERRAVRAVLRAAVVRWFNGSGTGLTTASAGPFAASFDNSNERRGVLWPSEVQALRAIRPRPTVGMIDLAGTPLPPLPRSQDPRLWNSKR
ncbi:hypothetical protein [Aldersonia kunmingensis]|uniref:hypothetical protein n=1 Tax=Aldersonia kunmingensis TaxID=408066 RepID=UPI00082F24BA|nr:hypothetical protein [Aldersonia kunmingensis]